MIDNLTLVARAVWHAVALVVAAGCQLRGRQRTELGDLGWPHSERTTNHPTKEPDLVTVYAISDATTNAQLIAQCAQLGHLTADMTTLDATYGLGRFWTVWRPDRLYGCDLDPTRARNAIADFTALPFPDGTFDAVVFDPPYKLNGASHGRGPASCDSDYGVGGGMTASFVWTAAGVVVVWLHPEWADQ